jgi:hypothetical protein
MLKIERPKTVDEYIDLVHQAVYEVDELSSIAEDEEEAERYSPWLSQFDALVRQLYSDMTEGRYQFDPYGADLPFMIYVKKYGKLIPFTRLLHVINDTHRLGLDVGTEK